MFTNTILFLATVISLIIVPGPDMLYVTSRALASGKESGIKAAIGISTGYLVFTLLVAMGLGALFLANPNIFLIMKILGAIYLMFLAYQLFISDITSFSKTSKQEQKQPNELKYGFLTSLLNPKGLVFYFALLPQFYIIDTMPFWIYALIYGSLTSLLCFLIYSSVGALAANKGRQLLINHRHGKIMTRLAGLCVFTIALTMVLLDFFH
ncbi:LysE family translocator [Polycladidibacter stylochi]|uniref:LysE family translocator n=1 Tax=Polycladidibacter stylochi TaxID=1807766 RepID=UPI00082974B1|nr:LysE family translocator [Pseudovibrio stylochi]